MGIYRGFKAVQVFDNLEAARMAIPASGAMAIEVWENGDTSEFVRDPDGVDLEMYDGSRWRRELSGSAAAAIAQDADAKATEAQATADDAQTAADAAQATASSALTSAAEAKAAPFRPFESWADFIAANVPPAVQVASATVGGVLVHWRRNASGTVGPTADGGMWSPADASFMPQHFGAVGDGVTDSAAAFSALFAYIKTIRVPTPGEPGPSAIHIKVPPGYYYWAGPVNATEIRARLWTVDAYGAQIRSAAAGSAAIDFTGSRFGRFNGLTLYGDAASPPRFLIQLCRYLSGQSAGEFTFHDLELHGHTTVAHLFNYASEGNTYSGTCRVYQQRDDGQCYICQGFNLIEPSLIFTDQQATGPQSNLESVFLHADMRINNLTGTQPVLTLARVAQHHMYGYLAGNTGAPIVIYSDESANKDVLFNIHGESVIDHLVRFETTGGGGVCNIDGFRFTEANNRAAQAVFLAGASITNAVNLNAAEVTVASHNVTPVAYFSPSNRFNVTGDIRIGSDVGVVPSVASLRGRMTVGAKAWAGLPLTFTPILAGSVTTGANTYTLQAGHYRRVGDLVFVEIDMQLSAKSSTGNLRIIGLPFVSNTTNGLALGNVAYYAAVTLAAGESVTAYQLSPNLSSIALGKNQSTGVVPLTDADIGNNFRISISLTYRINP